jgi:hypothetical protein
VIDILESAELELVVTITNVKEYILSKSLAKNHIYFNGIILLEEAVIRNRWEPLMMEKMGDRIVNDGGGSYKI